MLKELEAVMFQIDEAWLDYREQSSSFETCSIQSVQYEELLFGIEHRLSHQVSFLRKLPDMKKCRASSLQELESNPYSTTALIAARVKFNIAQDTLIEADQRLVERSAIAIERSLALLRNVSELSRNMWLIPRNV
jgi:hypothetical protein